MLASAHFPSCLPNASSPRRNKIMQATEFINIIISEHLRKLRRRLKRTSYLRIFFSFPKEIERYRVACLLGVQVRTVLWHSFTSYNANIFLALLTLTRFPRLCAHKTIFTLGNLRLFLVGVVTRSSARAWQNEGKKTYKTGKRKTPA